MFAEDAHDGELRQVAGLLDYLSTDYEGAVAADGHVVNDAEYKEQLELIGETVTMATRAGVVSASELGAQLTGLQARMNAKAAPSEVHTLALGARRTLINTYHLSLTPTQAPNFERGQKLFHDAACTSCHGESGDGQGAAGANLSPKPANFRDIERMRGVSPGRAFHAISYGIAGTGMASFDQISANDRWNLAFYVTALRFSESDAARGKEIAARLHLEIPTSEGPLSERTNDEIISSLPATVSANDRDAVVAYLRRVAPFDNRGDGAFAVARAKLQLGLSAYKKGDFEGARHLFVSAYLDGVEPHEAPLRTNQAALLGQIENAMMGVRDAVSLHISADAMQKKVDEAGRLLDKAEDTQSSGTSALIGSAMIALREGFEAALLIAALLGLVRKRGNPEQVKFVHYGWIAALPAGFLTWLLLGKLIGGLERELAEGIVALLAAFVLLGVTHWMFGQLSSKQFFGFLFKRANAQIQAGSGKAAVAIFVLAFVAAYREVFEVVLFYQAMLLDAGTHTSSVWLGILLGLGGLAIIALLLKLIGQKLEPRPFMLGSSVLLAALSIVMVGKGIRALQEAAVVPSTWIWTAADFPTFGIFGTREGLLAQALLFTLLIASAAWPMLSSRGSDANSPQKQA